MHRGLETAPTGLRTESEIDSLVGNCVHHLIEAQVERTPDAIAVISEEQSITYQELNSRANQLARQLRAIGVGPETLVGICLDRSIEMIIALLGILKAGGAYVPLDPTYPAERLRLMLEDAQVAAVLTQEDWRDRFQISDSPHSPTLPLSHSPTLICLDRDGPGIAEQGTENLPNHISPDNLAYIIYTSGTTGAPKGVMVEHRSLVNYIEVASTAYNLDKRDRVLQFASLSFDTSAEEIYPALARGATLILRTDAMLGSVRTFLQTCQEWAITILNLPTAYWHEIVARMDIEGATFPDSIRLVIIGGERAQADRLAMWRNRADARARLVNTYGPTEATIVATMADLSESDGFDSLSEVPIGRPIGNTQAYILDRNLRPLPVGIPGELYIGGIGLARGYRRSPELTAERFIPNPFSREPGARLYKTGDRARWRADGTIEFLDRLDHQIKIRGYRIELEEVEAALRQHPDVRDGVVLSREDGSGEKRLVAYAVLANQSAPTTSELHQFVGERLPAYMIPSTFVTLDAFPLTASGKVDRRALSSLDGTQTDIGRPFVAPRTAAEEALARIWAEVLGLEKVGVYDNFFELGGHSLLAARMIFQARDVFQIELPLKTVFENPTIEQLALVIEERLIEEIESMTEEEAQQLLNEI